MQQTQVTTLPRELHQWVQSLNLTYKISNPKRDLSNGWVFAEIVSRYYPDELEMYQFDNGFKLDKKTNNWEHLARFFKKKHIDVEYADYDPVIHCAPNAAYQLLKKLYRILTGRKINDSLVSIQEQYQKDESEQEPEYARQTIARKMKDKELQRIEDKKKMVSTAQNIVDSHVHTRKTERQTNGFDQTKRTGYYAHKAQEASAKVLSQQRAKQSQQQTINGVTVGDIKSVTVKTANKTIRVMRQEANHKRENKTHPGLVMPMDEDSDELALENLLTDIIGRQVAAKLNKQDPEFKVFKEHAERGVGYFNERFSYIPDEIVVDIFLSLQDHVNEIIAVISKCMLDIPDLLKFFGQAFKNVNCTISSKGSGDNERSNNSVNIFNLMVETLTMIANRLLNHDPQSTELFFLEYGVQELCYVMADNVLKLSEMSVLLYCFVQGTNNSHLRVLKKLAEKLGTHLQYRSIFPHFLARLFLFENEDMSADVYSFYLEHATRGLHASSPVTRTKCFTVLSYLSRVRLEPILPLLKFLEKQHTDDYWELKGQLLILASNVLLQFNSVELPAEGAPTSEKTSGSQRYSKLSQNKDGEVAASEKKSVQAEDTKSQSAASDVSIRHEASASGRFEEIQLTQKSVEEFTPMLFNIIYSIFKPNAPKATLKIGLIYLAKIMDFYPEFTDKYLEILLTSPENIRSSTLEMNPLPGTEEEVYVSGSNTEKYRTYGAPQEWNSLFVSQALHKAVFEEQLEVLDWPHIEIFEACSQQEFKEEDLEQWLHILSKMKNYFLFALLHRDYSVTTIKIIKKFFFHPLMQERVIKECLEVFIQMLENLYKPDIDIDCKENVRELLETLHEGNSDERAEEDNNQKLKDFVYKAVKAFAEQNKRIYQDCNLIELMNKVVHERRGEIFEGENEPAMATTRSAKSGKTEN